MSLQGQWEAELPEHDGYVCFEIDEYKDRFEGRGCFFQNGSKIVTVSTFVSRGKPSHINYSATLEYQQVGSTAALNVQALRSESPDHFWPEEAYISLKANRNQLKAEVSLTGPDGFPKKVTFLLARGNPERKSDLKPERSVRTWEKFKQFLSTLPADRYIFRGQPVTKRLRTSFHRTSRKDLNKYSATDIPRLHRYISPMMRHLFDLNNANHNAAFWNLLQHHGYPTPLLDWSFSPYVAAYFAFRTARDPIDTKDRVRVFMFDAASWRSDFHQLPSVVNSRPHFSLLEPLALENPRALPQQALSAIATVDDIEGYLSKRGAERGKDYLKIFDLPSLSRSAALQDLRMMGITASSLFPGIDGTCETLRLQMFGN